MPTRFKAPKDLVETALRIDMPEGAKIVKGLTVSGDWFVDKREKMQDIIAHFPTATAVDMESCAIAQVCAIYKTPFISFRIISDVPLKDTDASTTEVKMERGCLFITMQPREEVKPIRKTLAGGLKPKSVESKSVESKSVEQEEK